MDNKDNKSALIAELEVGASYSSLMSATSLFFTGILISQYKSFSSTIKVPLIYLIISTFSFIFAATIYNNAGNELTLNKLKAVEKYMSYAKNIVELLGLYLFILSVPMVIGAVTRDNFLRTTTIVVAIFGFVMYSQSKFSILEKELTTRHKRYLSSCITILALLLYYTQARSTNHSMFIYSFISIVLLLIIFSSAVIFSIKSKQYKPTIVRAFENDDATMLSKIIFKNLDAIKVKRYPTSIVDEVRKHSTPEAIQNLAKEKQIFVAEFDNKIVGLACLDTNTISTVFTDPDLHRKGIGRVLSEQIEVEAAKKGFQYVQAYANKLNVGFYRKLGYKDIKEIEDDNGTKKMLMRQKIYENISAE